MLAFFDVNTLCTCDGSLLLELAILSEADIEVATLGLSSTDCVEMSFSAGTRQLEVVIDDKGRDALIQVLLPTIVGFASVECDVFKLSLKQFRGLSSSLVDVHTGAFSNTLVT